MGLTKVLYIDGLTVIYGQNLNDIQDAIIALEGKTIPDLSSLTPENLGIPSAGTSADAARADHKHDYNSDFKNALLQLAAKVAYIDGDGQQYYDELEAALTHRTLSSISAVYTQSIAVFTDEPLDSLKSELVVTANYSDGSTKTLEDTDYTLSGTLTAGTSTITVTYKGKTTTFTVNTVAGVDISTTPIAMVMTSNGAGSNWNSTTHVGSINANGTSGWPGGMIQGLSYLWSSVSSGIVKVEFDYTLTGYSSGSGAGPAIGVYTSANPSNNGAARPKAKDIGPINTNGSKHYTKKIDLSTLAWSDYNSNYFGFGMLLNANTGCNLTFSNLNIKVAV